MQTNFHSTDGTPLYDTASVRARLGQSGDGRNFWRNLEELADDPAFGEWIEHEFPRQFWDGAPQLNRRRFLQLLGGSLALAGLAGCAHQPQLQIAPYVNQPENITPGIPIHFASALTIGGYARGVLVESDEGRPVKIEGNPDHPANLGATDAVTQGLLWNLYDPDRTRDVRFRGEPSTWDALESALNEVAQSHVADQGAGLRILTETVTSPTLAAQLAQLQARFPRMAWHQYDPLNRDNARAGAQLAFGRDVQPRYHFDRVAVAVSLDDDFLLHGPANVRYARDFMSGRRVSRQKMTMNRLYVIESSPTLTGATADHRLDLEPSQIESAARALAAQLGAIPSSDAAVPADMTQWIAMVAGDLRKARGRSLVVAGERQSPAVHALAHAMNAALGNAGKTVEYLAPIEATPTDNGASLRALSDEMNAGRVQTLLIVGANPSFNAPVDISFSQGLLKVPLSFRLGTHHDETAALCTWSLPLAHELESWSDARAFDGTTSIVQPLIAPLYDGRSAHEITAILLGQIGRSGYDIVREFWQGQKNRAIAATKTTQPEISSVNGGAVDFGATNPNLTDAPDLPVANVNAPGPPLPQAIAPTPTPPYDPRIDAATTERRGTIGVTPDVVANRGSAGAMKPNSAAPDLDAMGVGPNPQATPPKANRPQPNAAQTGDFEAFWRAALHDGMIPNSAEKPLAIALQPSLVARLPAPVAAQNGLELEFRFDPYLLDGRLANNAWLHELPRPLTTLTWDNAIWISPATAAQYKLENEDVVQLTIGKRTLGGPVWIVPGQPDNTLSVQLGFGRLAAGAVGNNVGFNAYGLRRAEALFWEGGVKMHKLGVTQPLAQTQNHHNMVGRDLVIEGTLRQYAQTPEFARAEPDNNPDHPRASLYPEYPYPGHKWGMSIDLNSCIGCNACTIACQAENNIPVVGMEEVRRGREMHWIRVDTYFQGNPQAPRFLFQPVPCQQCENAPCEPVCPVGATLHSSEGINMQVYNRCVGTRYCSNNCPYKVRRFNFLTYTDYSNKPSLKILQNPEVTVRNRGVMEKCTYCIQRIQHAELAEQKAGVPMKDGAVVVACQQVCPTQAITFGDINLPGSAVAAAKAESLNYGILLELNTQPRTTYSARLTNPNEEVKA